MLKIKKVSETIPEDSWEPTSRPTFVTDSKLRIHRTLRQRSLKTWRCLTEKINTSSKFSFSPCLRGQMHLSRCVSPRQGPKNWDISHQRALFQKFGPILPTLTPFNLRLQNFPGPLAFRITIDMVLAPAGQLFIKIWPQGPEIFKFLCKNFRKIRMHFWSEFAPLLC